MRNREERHRCFKVLSLSWSSNVRLRYIVVQEYRWSISSEFTRVSVALGWEACEVGEVQSTGVICMRLTVGWRLPRAEWRTFWDRSPIKQDASSSSAQKYTADDLPWLRSNWTFRTFNLKANKQKQENSSLTDTSKAALWKYNKLCWFHPFSDLLKYENNGAALGWCFYRNVWCLLIKRLWLTDLIPF